MLTSVVMSKHRWMRKEGEKKVKGGLDELIEWTKDVSGIQNSQNLRCPCLEEKKQGHKEARRGKNKVRTWSRRGEEMHVYVCMWGRWIFVEGQFWDSFQILSELCRCLTLFHPLSFTVPLCCPLETRWRDDQESASVKTANQYSSSVWDETPRLHWKSQIANDSSNYFPRLWALEPGQSLENRNQKNLAILPLMLCMHYLSPYSPPLSEPLNRGSLPFTITTLIKESFAQLLNSHFLNES